MPIAGSGRAAGKIVGRTYCREDSSQGIERLDLTLERLVEARQKFLGAVQISWRHVSRKLELLISMNNHSDPHQHAVARFFTARNSAGISTRSKQYWESIAGCS